MKIFVGMLSGKILTLNVENTDTVASAKKKVEDEEGIPPERQILVFSGEQLEDRKTLRECGVCEECTLYVVIRKKFGMPILVKTTTGKTFTLNVERTDTIEAVKRKIQDKEGIRAEQQILVFSGARLEEGKTLRDYGVEKEDIVRLVYKISKMQLCLKGTHGRDDYLNAESKDAIGCAGQKIEDKEGNFPNPRTLAHEGKELENQKTSQDYNIGIDGASEVERQPDRIQLFVTRRSGERFSVEMEVDETIHTLKDKIRGLTGIPVENQSLYRFWEFLENEKTVGHYKMSNGENIRLFLYCGDLKIFVKTSAEKRVAVEVESADTIRCVKEKIEMSEGICVEKQRLKFGDVNLEDGNTLHFYGIEKGDVLFLSEGDCLRMWIFVKIWTGKIAAVDVSSTDTIGRVKEKIQSKEGIPLKQQILIYEGKELEDRKTLQDYCVKNEDSLHLALRSGDVTIFVKMSSGKTVTLGVDGTDSVEYVKQKIQGQEGIPSELQSLVFAGKELEDGKLLQDYHVQEEDTLRLALRPASKMHIFVKIGSGKSIALEVSSTDTIGQVKEKIANREGIPFGEQQVMFGGEQLEDGRTLEECGVEREDTLRVVFKAKQMRICVKEMCGRDIGVEVLSTDTVGRVKQKIQERRGVPRDLQTLVFAGAPLEDEKTLRHYNIVDEAVLYLMLRIGF